MRHAIIVMAVLAAACGSSQDTPAPAASVGRLLKNVGLFFAAPFIGLAYILFLPFFGVALAGWAVYQAIKRR